MRLQPLINVGRDYAAAQLYDCCAPLASLTRVLDTQTDHLLFEGNMLTRAAVAGLLAITFACADGPAQSPPAALSATQGFPLEASSTLHITREVDPVRPFSVIGPRGALLGQQDGSFEGWIFPWKIFSDMRITANMDNYPVPIQVNEHAAEIDIAPNATTIVYSHANFTIRQIMFAPKRTLEDSGVVVLYQIEAVRPMTLTFSFTPVMQKMWPAPSDDHPSPEWVKSQAGESGFYILHENFPGNAAALAIPMAQPGILAPYQERAKSWPLQFVLRFNPATDSHSIFPLLITVANTPQGATRDALAGSLATLNGSIQSLYESNAVYYRDVLARRTSIVTPDEKLNAAFSWAIAAIDQLRVETPGDNREALTAGFVGSGDSTRPGFGWFFGRDALWTLYAVNSFGDFETTKQEIEFLLHHQRADGKIMHEYSQTANQVDWSSLPYEYAAADPTPLLLMVTDDYWKVSGDKEFVQRNWDALTRAWNFETSHVSDDGIYNNTQGTGWVESWIPSMPYQEIYLAALDEQASAAFADLARAQGRAQLADQAAERASHIGQAIEREYLPPGADFYAFSRNPDGSTDSTATIFPSVAWWDGTYSLAHADTMMQRWASDEFSTDWGTRILSNRTPFYDPISYHQGSVWPLFTGWASVAEYRAGRALAGYAHLMQNADLTWSQDLGFTTELLSGDFFQPLGRSTAHQLWSSAMVISPLMRGLFGLEWNAASRTLSVNPQLPADWNSATVRNLPLGDASVTLTLTRRERTLVVKAAGPSDIHLISPVHGAEREVQGLLIPLPPVEVVPRHQLPEFGMRTEQMKVLDEQQTSRSINLTLEAPAGTDESIYLKENELGLHVAVAGGTLGSAQNGLMPVAVRFPAGRGYVTQKISASW